MARGHKKMLSISSFHHSDGKMVLGGKLMGSDLLLGGRSWFLSTQVYCVCRLREALGLGMVLLDWGGGEKLGGWVGRCVCERKMGVTACQALMSTGKCCKEPALQRQSKQWQMPAVALLGVRSLYGWKSSPVPPQAAWALTGIWVDLGMDSAWGFVPLQQMYELEAAH